jgi:hypothetical protein
MPTSQGDITAMDSLRDIVDNAGLPSYPEDDRLPAHKCFAFSRSYMSYETNKVRPCEEKTVIHLKTSPAFKVTCLNIAMRVHTDTDNF